jgi:hypothetical protein
MAGTIRGDEIQPSDVWFGGLCAHTACRVIEFQAFAGNPIHVEVRLRWNDPTRQLALYHFKGDPDLIPNVGEVDRYCCSSELVAVLNVNGYFDAIAVAFEQAGGGPPGPLDSQSFELTAKVVR